MTDHTQARSVWNMSPEDWKEMTSKLDATRVTAEDFNRPNDKASNLEERIRAFDNQTSEESLHKIVD